MVEEEAMEVDKDLEEVVDMEVRKDLEEEVVEGEEGVEVDLLEFQVESEVMVDTGVVWREAVVSEVEEKVEVQMVVPVVQDSEEV